MSIKNIKEDLSNRLYLAKFRIKHKDTHLINKLKLSSTLLFIVILIPCVSLALSYSSKQFSVKSEEKIIEQNSYMSIASSGKFRSPISGTITSNYGYRKDPISGKYSKHTGIDISIKVISMTESVFRVLTGMDTPRETSQSTKTSEKFSAAKALPKKPDKVMAT